MAKKKSLCVTYFLWLVGGFFGVHHFYLGRDRQAFLWWMSLGGYLGLGWLSDIWMIPQYVREANEDPKYVEALVERMRASEKPPNSNSRYFMQIVVADALGNLALSALPVELIPESYMPLAQIIAPLAVALGVHLVGNCGREEGPLFHALLGAYLVYPAYLFGYTTIFFTTVSSTYCFNNYGRRWRRSPNTKTPVCKRLGVLVLCAGLYLTLWSSYLYFNCALTRDDEEVKCRDAFKHFFQSPLAREFASVMVKLWEIGWQLGWRELWRNIVEALDPEGKAHALRVLELDETATEQQISSQYRKLSRQWHPDKHKDAEAKELAQEKFIEIAQAYEILIKSHRKSKKSESESETTG